jgi:Histidine kinase-, DNA gyrase B-, and HSP90-like ATPase
MSAARKIEADSEPLSKLKAQPGEAPVFRITRADTDLLATLAGLELQTGVDRDRGRRLMLKEYVDNALDACDAAGRGGQVTIRKLSDHQYEIIDQGDGIPGTPDDLAATFSIHRAMSTAKFWRLPTRGALGAGLRICAGFAIVCGGTVEITTGDHCVLLRPTRIGTQILSTTEVPHTIGTRIVITIDPELDEDDRDLDWAQAAIDLAKDADPAFARKPSPHWQDADQFSEILASIEPPDTTVRAFVERLDGCSGSKGASIAGAFGKGRTCRSLSPDDASSLLKMLQETAREIKPAALGLLGPGAAYGDGYAKALGTFEFGSREPHAVIPCAVEAWVYVENRKGTGARIEVFTNRTPAIERCSVWRDWNKKLTLSGIGLDDSIELAGGACRITLNVTSPLIPISSIGKRPNLKVFAPLISEAIRLAFNRSRKLLGPEPDSDDEEKPPKPPKPSSHKALMLKHLPAAIVKVSENGRYIFGQHNLFYVVRDMIQRDGGGKALTKGNFSGILTDYESEHGDIKGMIRDPRGSFTDLNGKTTEMGTTGVKEFRRPPWQFHKVLYSEKEDHKRILEQAGWTKRHDCPVLTNKGFSNRSGRDFIDGLVASGEPIIVFCIHDADAAGSVIMQSLQEATRARGARTIKIIDLGLYPWQAIKMGLPVEELEIAEDARRQAVSEYVRQYRDESGTDWDEWLQENRIELNAMTPAQLIGWLDSEVEKHGELKLVPPGGYASLQLYDYVEATIRDMEHDRIMAEIAPQIQAAVEARLGKISISLPGDYDLAEGLRSTVHEHRDQHWEDALRNIGDQLISDADEGDDAL